MMKKANHLYALLGALVMMSFGCLVLVVYPAFDPHFDFSSDKTANIGSTIGGIVGPIAGIFSTVLLVLTLDAQREANKDQRIKADSDVIFMLLNQLDKEYDSISHKSYYENGEVKVGFEALLIYSTEVEKDITKDNFAKFKNDERTNKFLYIIWSFRQIQDIVNVQESSQGSFTVFNHKLELYYNFKFKPHIRKILSAINTIDDPIVDEFKRFQAMNETSFR